MWSRSVYSQTGVEMLCLTGRVKGPDALCWELCRCYSSGRTFPFPKLWISLFIYIPHKEYLFQEPCSDQFSLLCVCSLVSL